MKRLVSLALALSMMFMCAGNVFAADFGQPTFQDSDNDISLELMMGEDMEPIEVPAAKSYQDSDSGNVTNWFFASGTAVKKGINEIVSQEAYAKYAEATWYTDAAYTKQASFTEADRYFGDMPLYAKLGETSAPSADVEVSEDVKNEGIMPEEITNTFPAGNKLKLDIAATPATTAQAVVNQLATENATIKAVDGSQPLYLDITLVDAQGNPIQPGQAATITVPVPDKLRTALYGGANAVLVIHYNDDGSMKDHMLATLTDDGKMTFSTASFSTFGFIAVEKTSFDVTIENVKGGILSVNDANGVMLPVGQKVAVPSKGENGYFNTLYVKYAPLENATASDLLVNGTSVGVGSERDDDLNLVSLNQDTVLTGVFAAEGSVTPPATDERYYVHVKPNTYNNTTPFSGTLQFKHRVDGKDTVLTDATFAFKNPAFDGQLFEISGTTLTSKQPLTKDNYSILMTVTAGGKTYEHNPREDIDCQAYIHLNRGEQYNVTFDRYHAEEVIPGYGPMLAGKRVDKGTAFATIAADQSIFGTSDGGIALKDGKPQMYAYEFDRWQQYVWNDDSDTPTPVNDATITRDIDAIAMFKGYRVNVQSLGGGGGGGGGGSSGGGGGGGGSTSLFGNKVTTTGIAQALTTAQAKAATSKAITAAKANGATEAVVRLKNATSISSKALQEIKSALKKAGMTGKIYSDIIVNGKIASRMYIDPSKIATTGNLDLGVTIGDKATEEKFAKQYSNPVQVLKLAQKGGFGTTVTVAAKVDLSKLNTKNLRFYSFDPATGKYAPIEKVEWAINKDGYLFFNVATGGTVVIADRPFTAK